ncbi:DUF4270 family protein [Pontibacter sp. CAU 1760]
MQFSRLKTLLQNKAMLLLCCCVALVSCEDPNELGLGLVDDNIAGRFTDTLTVNVSTVYLDSLATSATTSMLAGQYTTPYTGTLKANAFFQIGLGNAWTLAADATLDSVKLILPYSRYNYGDTTQTISYSLHRLTGNLQVRTLSPYFFNEQPYSYFYGEESLYNNSSVSAADEALATFSVRPRPTSKDTLKVKLPAALGQEWLSLKKAADTRLTDATAFLDYFKGLKLTSTSGSAVIGFPAASSVKVRLYYSETANGSKVAKTKDFPFTNNSVQFNQIRTNLEGSLLEGVVRGGQPVPASATNNVSVAHSGSGLMIKLEVPNISKLKGQLPADLINKALLVVEPLSNTTSYPYPAPATLGLYTTNSSNVPLTPLLSGQAELTAVYKEPSPQNANGRYDFDLTSQIVDLLKQDNPGNLTLLLAPPAAAYRTVVNRLVVGGPKNQQQSIKLKIYYTTIK